MKNKLPLLFLLGFVLIGLIINSCKKNTQSAIPALFTNGKWQLASVLVTNTNNAVTTTTTFNTVCDSTQMFTFNTDNTCTYTNFSCIPQKSSGHWSLSADQLTLYVADMTCDTSAIGGKAKPFAQAQIVNLGDYSLVLQTGDYNVIPTTTNKTRVVRYGFVRQKASIK
ncbi:MAG: hypothetical protein JWR67_2284 [Mucilaginibacter sp.]|nr:hypothetical protein [Mucilaginibacter sp.]